MTQDKVVSLNELQKKIRELKETALTPDEKKLASKFNSIVRSPVILATNISLFLNLNKNLGKDLFVDASENKRAVYCNAAGAEQISGLGSTFAKAILGDDLNTKIVALSKTAFEQLEDCPEDRKAQLKPLL